ncbi:hypothetical protein SCUP515_12630 [Seiridium cupressi]
MTDKPEWVSGIAGNFPLHKAVADLLPNGTRIISSETCGISAWTKTAKISVVLPDETPKRYFLKYATGKGAKPLTEGEYHSAIDINNVISGLVPKPAGRGEYHNGETQVYFFLGDYHDMDFSVPPEPAEFMGKIAELHEKGVAPNGLFGYHVPTAIGILERTVVWEQSWAKSFTHQLKDAVRWDNETNGPWPEYDDACQQLFDVVIPRLLGVLQSDGRTITPVLIHGDLWERNVGIDMETGDTVLFDPGCTYAHNEMEFGTASHVCSLFPWRCSWAFYFNSHNYMRHYQRLIEPSEPSEEWDDRNRLYAIYPYIVDSGGHAGSASRQLAYNDLFLCEKYGPFDTADKYDPEKDISITGARIPFVMKQLE